MLLTDSDTPATLPASLLSSPATGATRPPSRTQTGQTRCLTGEEYRSTFSLRMRPAEFRVPLPSGFRLYTARIPESDYQGFDCSEGSIHSVWISSASPFLHVLISARDDPRVFMVVIIDLHRQAIFGHRLVDLRRG